MTARGNDFKSEKTIVQYTISGKQVNINTGSGTINTIQSNEEKGPIKQIIIINKNYNNYQQKSHQEENWSIFLGVIALIWALSVYVQYHWQIRIGVVVVSIMIETLTCLIYNQGKNSEILYDKKLKRIAIFNITSVISVPIMIAIISSSKYNSKIDFDFLQQQIASNGIVQVYFNVSDGKYALFQMVGILLIGIFFLYIVISDLYIIAVINIVMEKKGQRFWKWLLGRTCGMSKDGIIIIGAALLVLSIIMTIGVLPYFLSLCQRGS